MKRREFMADMAGGAMAGLFGANLVDLLAAGRFAAASPDEQAYEFLKPEQVSLLDALTSQIIPTDDTPGAHEAHVVRFIDHAFATFLKPRQPQFNAAYAEFDGFAKKWKPGDLPYDRYPGADQIAILTAFEKKHEQSFFMLRRLTMAGMFSHPEHGGNYGRVGWQLIGYEDRYSWAQPFGYYDR